MGHADGNETKKKTAGETVAVKKEKAPPKPKKVEVRELRGEYKRSDATNRKIIEAAVAEGRLQPKLHVNHRGTDFKAIFDVVDNGLLCTCSECAGTYNRVEIRGRDRCGEEVEVSPSMNIAIDMRE